MNYSISLNAQLSSVSANVAAGIVVSDSGGGYAPGVSNTTTAAVALTSGVANSSIIIQTVGVVPASISGLGAGQATHVVANTSTGILSRKTEVAISDFYVGECDSSGNVSLSINKSPYLLALKAIGASVASVAVGQGIQYDGSAFQAVGIRPVFNVKTYGAVGDGINDDGPAIQQAINAASSANGDVYIPSGTYGVRQNLGLSNANGVRIFGDGVDATIIKDLRTNDITGAPTGNYYGLLSFYLCNECSVRSLTLQGFVSLPIGDAINLSLSGGRKGCFSRNSNRITVEGIRATQFLDETIYADATIGHSCREWKVIRNRVDNTNSNGININLVYNQDASGTLIDSNVIDTVASSAIQVGGMGVVVRHNWMTAPQGNNGFWPIVIDAGSMAQCIENTIYNWVGNGSSPAAIAVFGGSQPATAQIDIRGNVMQSVNGQAWEGNQNGGIHVQDFGGTMRISGNVFYGCGRSPTNGAARAIAIEGSTPATIYVEGNKVVNTSGNNVNVGVYVHSDVPAGKVVLGRNYFSNVATPHVVSGNVSTDRLQQTVAATGMTTVLDSTETVIVIANGGVTATLPDAAKNGAGKQVIVKNASTQLGTTLVAPAGTQKIDGSGSSVSLVGANKYVRVESDGSNWLIVGSG